MKPYRHASTRNRYFLIATFALGLYAIFALPTERILDWEEFRHFGAAREPLGRFLSQVNESSRVIPRTPAWSAVGPIWLSWRLFPTQPAAWRLFSMLVAACGLLLMALLARRVLVRSSLAVAALLLLCVNQYFIEYSRWALTTYVLGLVYPIAVLYVFWLFSRGVGIRAPQRILAFVLGALGVVLNMREGLFLAFVCPVALLLHHAVFCRHKPLISIVSKLVNVLIYGAGIVLVNIPRLFTILKIVFVPATRGIDAPDHSIGQLYYFQSGAPRTAAGFLHFHLTRAWQLLSGLLAPIADDGQWLSILLVVFFFAGVAAFFLQVKEVRRLAFIFVLLAVGWLTLIVYNLLTLYPFGSPRYCLSLVPPTILVTVSGLAFAVESLGRWLRIQRRALALAVLNGVLFVSAVALYVPETARRFRDGRSAERIIALMRSKADAFLVEARHQNMFSYYAPQNAARAYWIPGPGGSGPALRLPADLAQRIREKSFRTLVTVWTNPWCGQIDLRRWVSINYRLLKEREDFPEQDYRSSMSKYDLVARKYSLKAPPDGRGAAPGAAKARRVVELSIDQIYVGNRGRCSIVKDRLWGPCIVCTPGAPPDAMALPVPTDAQSANLVLMMAEGSWNTADAPTAGLRLNVSLATAKNQEPVFARFFDPVHNSRDRQIVEFNIPLDADTTNILLTIDRTEAGRKNWLCLYRVEFLM